MWREPHMNGLPHDAAGIRALRQHRWLPVVSYIYDSHKIRCGVSSHLNAWPDLVVYYCVASNAKPPQCIDHHPTHWTKHEGSPGLREYLPAKWKKEGFVRKTKLTAATALDLCREASATDESSMWALAERRRSDGDPGLFNYLSESHVLSLGHKVRVSAGATATIARRAMSRLQILEAAATEPCSCQREGECYASLKRQIRRCGVDGPLQAPRSKAGGQFRVACGVGGRV